VKVKVKVRWTDAALPAEPDVPACLKTLTILGTHQNRTSSNSKSKSTKKASSVSQARQPCRASTALESPVGCLSRQFCRAAHVTRAAASFVQLEKSPAASHHENIPSAASRSLDL